MSLVEFRQDGFDRLLGKLRSVVDRNHDIDIRVRFLLRASAKGAARTTKRVRNCFAPRSVLREFLRREREESAIASRRGGFQRLQHAWSSPRNVVRLHRLT